MMTDYANCATTTSFSSSLTWNTASSLPEAIGVNGYSYLYAGGLPIEQIAPDGSVLYYLHNLQGSTVALTGRAGTLEATYSYSPYGSVTRSCVRTALFYSNFSYMDCTSGLFNEPPQALSEGNFLYLFTGLSGLARSGTAGVQAGANHFLYCGQYRDSASGLYYLRARWYDPATGQFTSVDPLVALTGQPYSYAGNNPVNGSDPSGLGPGFCLTFWNCGSSSPGAYSCEGISSLTRDTSPSGCSGGVYVYSKLVSYINNHTSFSSCTQFLRNTYHILATLWNDVYKTGAIGHKNCYRWTGTQYNCTLSGFMLWFSDSAMAPSTATLGEAAFQTQADSLAGLVNGGSEEGTVAWWLSKIGTQNRLRERGIKRLWHRDCLRSWTSLPPANPKSLVTSHL